MTKRSRKRARSVMMSSVRPSARRSCLASPLKLVKGSTAIDGLSGKGSAGTSAEIALAVIGAGAAGQTDGQNHQAPPTAASSAARPTVARAMKPRLRWRLAGRGVPLSSSLGRAAIRGGGEAIGAYRARDVLDCLLAPVLEGIGQPVADLIAYGAGDADPAWLGETFEPRRNVHAVAVDIAAVDDDVAQIDADAKLDPPLRRHVGVALAHRCLDLDGALYGLDDAGELDQRTVAHQLDCAASMRGDLGLNEFPAARLEAGERALLVRAHQARVGKTLPDLLKRL